MISGTSRRHSLSCTVVMALMSDGGHDGRDEGGEEEKLHRDECLVKPFGIRCW